MKQNTVEYKIGGLESADIDRIHQKAEGVLKAAAFKEDDFKDPRGPYSDGAVERDKAEVKKREEEWKKRRTAQEVLNKKIATIFEAIIFEHAELSEWLGEGAFTFKTSTFDDYENGVDAVVEFADPDSSTYLGVAMDVTFSSNPDSSDGMTKKFERIFERIQKGTLTKVKYFHAKNKNISIHGQLNDVPEVVIGADKATVLELAELWTAKKQKMLGEHKIQAMILLQIEAQLKVFISFAEAEGKTDEGKTDIVEIFKTRLAIIQKILEQKKDLVRKVTPDLGDDKVHYAMMNFLKHKEREIAELRTAA